MHNFERDLMFLLHDVARLIRLDADKRARAHGMTRAQWGILIWLERQPGLSQKELAEILEVERKRLREDLESLNAQLADERQRLNARIDHLEQSIPEAQEAVRVVCEMGKASTSTLQRRLRLGYGRAARILDMMQRDGIIGPPDGSKPRAVLISKEEHSRDN